jgi:hypothetical protein
LKLPKWGSELNKIVMGINFRKKSDFNVSETSIQEEFVYKSAINPMQHKYREG